LSRYYRREEKFGGFPGRLITYSHFSLVILDLSFVIEEKPQANIRPMTNDKSKITNEK
jgi:hypothetical protein